MSDDGLPDLLLQLSPSARDSFRTVLIRDNRDEIAAELLRYGDVRNVFTGQVGPPSLVLRRVLTRYPQLTVITFAPLQSVDPDELLALLTDPRVLRHMPLAGPELMRPDELGDWVAGKEAISQQYGFGPQAILLNGSFAGWGGIEPDGDGASISLVLLPAQWGHGHQVLDLLLEQAFGQRGLPYVLVEFPPSRTRVSGLLHLGFREVGDRMVGGEQFVVYRLDAPSA